MWIFSCDPPLHWILCAWDFTPFLHLSPSTLWMLGWSMVGPHLSPTCPLVPPLSFSCLGFFSQRDFALVSQLSPTTPWILCPRDFTLVFYCCLGCSESECSGSHDFTLAFHSSMCFLLHLGFFARMIVHLSPTCTCVSHLLLRIFNFFVTCGLLVSDFAPGRQQEFQISNHGASDSGTTNFARSQ